MLELLLSYVLIYEQPVLFTVGLAASFGIPLPMTALVIASGALSAQGYLDFWGIFGWGLAGCVIGDALGYFLSLKYGKDAFRKIGLGRMLEANWFGSLERGFHGHWRSSVFYSRFLVTVIGPAVNVLSGLSAIPYWKYVSYGAPGQAIYVFLFAGLGYLFSDEWNNISDLSGDVGTGILLLVVLAVSAFWLVKYARGGTGIKTRPPLNK